LNVGLHIEETTAGVAHRLPPHQQHAHQTSCKKLTAPSMQSKRAASHHVNSSSASVHCQLEQCQLD
jgi:hypothetical protein